MTRVRQSTGEDTTLVDNEYTQQLSIHRGLVIVYYIRHMDVDTLTIYMALYITITTCTCLCVAPNDLCLQ